LIWEPFVRRAPAEAEESLAEFVKRRIGQEFLDYAINPFVAGVYAGDPARLSVKQAFPKLHALEQRYGSLILGQILGARERKRRAEVSKPKRQKGLVDEGLEVLTKALGTHLGDRVWTSSTVTGIQQNSTGWALTARVGGRELQQEHSAVVYTGPAYRLPEVQLTTQPRLDWASLARITIRQWRASSWAPLGSEGVPSTRRLWPCSYPD